MASEKISMLCIIPGNEIPERFIVGQRPVYKGNWHGKAIIKEIKFFLASSYFVKYSTIQPIYVVEYENSNARTIIPANFMASVTVEKLAEAPVQQPGIDMFDDPVDPVQAPIEDPDQVPGAELVEDLKPE